MVCTIIKYVLTQYSLKQGFAKYGQRAEEATENELDQIHNINTVTSLDANKLSEEEKKSAIASSIF